MAVHELVEVRQLSPRGVAVAFTLPTVLLTVKTILLPHEGVGIFLYFLANSRVLLQIRLQRTELLTTLPVSHQRRVFANLLGYFTMAVHELVEVRQLSPRGVAVA